MQLLSNILATLSVIFSAVGVGLCAETHAVRNKGGETAEDTAKRFSLASGIASATGLVCMLVSMAIFYRTELKPYFENKDGSGEDEQ